MVCGVPGFSNVTGYFPDRNIDTEFYSLNEGLRRHRAKLGDDLYHKLREMSDRMRAHFDADPEDKTDDSRKARAIIFEMEDLLDQYARAGGIWT